MLLSAVIGAGAPSAAQDAADLVLRHGTLYPVSGPAITDGAVAIRGDRIAYVGSDAGVAPWIGAATQVVELGGRAVTPGLIDAHAHLMGLGGFLEQVDLFDTTSYAEVVERVAAAAAAVPPARRRSAAAGRLRTAVTSALDPTYTVSALCDEVRTFLGEAFSSLWVAGEVQRFRESQRGHVYFELVEKDASDGVCGKLEAVVWARDWLRVRRILVASGQRVEEGMAIRCRGGIDFYGVGGRLQLVVREIDPVFTLGMLERRRRETLAALEAAGLLDLNRALALPAPPLSVALVT
jgi:hypothetical protein